MPRNNCTPIYVNGRPVGFVRGEIFYKSIQGSRHLLRRPPAIAFDVASLNAAEDAGASEALITDLETGCQYRASIAHVRRAGFEFDRGFGRQIALPLAGWLITRRGEIPARQLRLWQGGGR